MMAMASDSDCIPVITLTGSEAGTQEYAHSLLNATATPGVTILPGDVGVGCTDVTQHETDQGTAQTFTGGIFDLNGEPVVQYLVLGKDGQFTQVPVLTVEGNQLEGHAESQSMEFVGSQSSMVTGNQQPCGDSDGKLDRLQCGTCGEVCDDVLKFLQHKAGHVGRGVGIGCEFCHLSFSRQIALTEHYRRKHKVLIEDSVTTSKPIKSARTHCRREQSGSKKATTKQANGKTDSYDVVSDVDAMMKDDGGSDGTSERCVPQKTDDSLINTAENIKRPVEVPVKSAVMSTDSNADVKFEFKVEELKHNTSAMPNATSITGCTTSDSGEPAVNMKNFQQVSLLTGKVANISVPIVNESKNGFVGCISGRIIKNGPDNTGNNTTCGIPAEDATLEGRLISDIQQSVENKEEKSVTSISQARLITVDSSIIDDSHIEPSKGISSCIDGTESVPQNDGSVKLAEPLHYIAGRVSELPEQVMDVNQDTGGITGDNQAESGKENIKQLSLNVSAQEKSGISYQPEKTSPGCKNPHTDARSGKAFTKDLDMPDFYFILIVDHAPKRKKIGGAKNNFKCLYCYNTFAWRSTLCKHMQEKHLDILKVGGLLVIPTEDIDLEPGQAVTKMSEYIKQERSCKRVRGVEKQDLPGDFPCDNCGKMFHRLRYLRKHIRLHKADKDYLCTECVKSFKTLANLKQHMKTHKQREMFKCSQCNFESNINIAIHLHRQIHSGGCVLCDVCGQAYNDRSTLAKHMQVHDMKRPFPCNYPGCTWRFRTMMMCHAHYRSHTSKGKFECGECGYVFRKKHHLYRHERKAHNIFSERRPYYRYTEPVTIEYNFVTDQSTTGNIATPSESNATGNGTEGVVDMVTDGVNETTCVTDNVAVEEQFDLESALQNGQLVIATDTGTAVNYEMSDITAGYQTLLQDSDGNQLDSATILIPQSDGSHILYQHEETIDAEVTA